MNVDVDAVTFNLGVCFLFMGKNTYKVRKMRYRANTAVLGVYLEILPDGKIRSGFFVDDLREWDNFQSVRMFTSAFHCVKF